VTTATSPVTPSPAGAITEDEARGLPRPPRVEGRRLKQILHFNQRQIEFVFGARRRHGEVFGWDGPLRGDQTITSHPDHVRSLFTAKPHEAQSLTPESPVRPVVGPSSVLTAVGPRHLRQRKLLLAPFHGEAIEQYEQLIVDATAREIDRWPSGRPIALAPRMQAITLDVIMGGVFGIEGLPGWGTPERRLREATRAILYGSTLPLAQVAEVMNIGKAEPVGLQRAALALLDRAMYAVIAARREATDVGERRDILSLLIGARPTTARRCRTASCATSCSRSCSPATRRPRTSSRGRGSGSSARRMPHARLVETVRGGDGEDAETVVEQTIQESMRCRPVVPMVGRRVLVPWRLGDFAVEADSPVQMSVLLLHHREDLYPDPFAFRPERWEGRKPATYEWIPFGGGIRRCLGAALAMAEQRIVLAEMARRLDVRAADPAPEHAAHRNVTMIPAQGGRVVITARRP
jgi:cytochrome P450